MTHILDSRRRLARRRLLRPAPPPPAAPNDLPCPGRSSRPSAPAPT